MRTTLPNKILTLLIVASLVTTQFLPGYAAMLHAEEGDSTSSSASSGDSSSSDSGNSSSADSSDNSSNDSNGDSSSDSSDTSSGSDTSDDSSSGDSHDEVGTTNTEAETDNNETSAGSDTENNETESNPESIETETETTTGSDTDGAEAETETTFTDPTDSTNESGPSETNSSSGPTDSGSIGNLSSTTTPTTSSSTPDTTSQDSDDVDEEVASSSPATAPSSSSSSSGSSESFTSHSTTTPGQTVTTHATTTPSIPLATTTPETATTTATSTPVAITTPTATSTPITSTSTPTILSGHAVAMANILNILNANMINSEGAILLSNFFDDQYGTLDLRGTSGGNCGLANCTTGGIQVNLLNTAAINNSIMVTATTGENIIDGAGHGTIRTGDAYAGLNMVNVANTNFVDSRYLMVSLNAFSNVNGDIVFPALASFFNTLNPGAATQHITNSADVDNDVSVTANTGNNNATTASSTITTGDAISTSNVFNNINTNLSGGNTLHILLRVHGEWVGDIFGATGEFEALRNNSTVHISNGSSGGTNNTAVHATNTSVIRNNVNVTADTGHNEVRNASSSTIDTGDAYAAANILNVANANVIGKNWMLAIINIFGDFNGNVSFGRPDLWVGEQIHAPSKIENGTELEYKFTVINNGDLAATQVRLRDTYHEKIDVVSSSHAYTESNGTLEWHIGTLPPGGATEITYRGQISGARPGTKIENTVRVSALEPDNNMSDNTDSAYIWTAERVIKVKKEKIPEPVEDMDAATSTSPIDVIQVTRTTQSSVVKNVGMKAPQELIIVNPTSHTIKSVVLRDAMKDPSGAAVQTEEWILGDVLPHEEIKITYDIQFGSQAEPGAYMLSTTLIGSASTTKTLALNGVVNLLAPEVIAEVFLPKKAEASVNTTTSATIEAEEEPDPTPVLVDTTEQLASAADTGFDFNPLWLVAIGIGSIAVVGRKKMYQWLFL